MIKKSLFILLLILICSCSTTKSIKYINVPLTEPPKMYYPNDNIRTQKQLLQEYLRQMIVISEWQKWYNIQVGSNYYIVTNK